MANRSYQKGVRREHDAMRRGESLGYLAIRSAGSHGLFDVVLANGVGVRFVQIKCDDNPTPAEREALRDIALPPNCTKEIWTYRTGRKEPIKMEVID